MPLRCVRWSWRSPRHIGGKRIIRPLAMLNSVMQKAPCVVAVAASNKHSFCKEKRNAIRLIAGRGIAGDSHCGIYVQHLYDKAKDHTRANLRQVHLIEEELIEHLKTLGFDIKAGELGENVTTRNLNLIELRAGARLKLGDDAVIEITGLRAPCVKIERFKKSLRRAVTDHRSDHAFMKSAVMAVVIKSGTVRVGDDIEVKGRGSGLLPFGPV